MADYQDPEREEVVCGREVTKDDTDDFDWGSKIVEVCVDSTESALKAIEGGANMLQLSEGLTLGGLTPSVAFMKWAGLYVRDKVPLFVKIASHSGHFQYSEADMIAMAIDITDARTHGCHGVVFGILDENFDVDIAKCKNLMDAAQTMPVTFSRAFDLTRDPKKALESLIELGFSRVLTSGCNQSCLAGCPLIKELIEQADERIIVVPAGDINEDNLEAILRSTGAIEVNLQVNVPRSAPETSARACGRNAEAFGPVYQECCSKTVSNLVKIAKKVWF